MSGGPVEGMPWLVRKGQVSLRLVLLDTRPWSLEWPGEERKDETL